MGKSYEPSELVEKIFYISMAGVAAFIAVVLLFIL
jgi:hypothetical protein